MTEEQPTSYDSMDQSVNDPEEYHPPLSPASGAETLFLAGLTASFSPDDLSKQLRKNQSASCSVSLNTTATDDFVSAAGTMDDLYQFAFDDEDQAARSQQLTIPEFDSDTTDEDSTSMPKTKKAAAAAKQDPTPMPPKEPVVVVATAAATEPAAAPEGSHPDAASAAYEGVKGVWAWGKSVPVFSPFMGFTEAVAGKALEVAAGTNLRDIDGNVIKPNLEKFDSGVLNPVVETVAGMMLGAAGKVEEVVKPIVVLVLSPFKMLTQPPPPPADDAPEVTTEAGN